ncbi:WXG100 family type VII secretion target [Mycobacterium hubeiense]|uniref:WXG100 family type VII secretion target n=1 Tax=Mycobacterium hubeiense TaxID=1867256 RepID=UPI000C7F59CB|nr:WXG100 family type VII secretion target [Mycobacterium sp. QGD 101]
MKVNPEHVHQSGVEINRAAESLRTQFSSSDGSIAASLGGWVGNSATAMTRKAASWSDATRTLHADLTAHGAKFVEAANRYRRADAEAADKIRAAGQAIASSGN